MEEGWGDVEQAGAEDEFIGFEAGAGSGEDPLRAVPDGDAGGDAGGEFGAEVVAVEAVVGHQDHGGIGAGEIDEALQE